jgi:hypothetical protein
VNAIAPPLQEDSLRTLITETIRHEQHRGEAWVVQSGRESRVTDRTEVYRWLLAAIERAYPVLQRDSVRVEVVRAWSNTDPESAHRYADRLQDTHWREGAQGAALVRLAGLDLDRAISLATRLQTQAARELAWREIIRRQIEGGLFPQALKNVERIPNRAAQSDLMAEIGRALYLRGGGRPAIDQLKRSLADWRVPAHLLRADVERSTPYTIKILGREGEIEAMVTWARSQSAPLERAIGLLLVAQGLTEKWSFP